MSRCSILHVFKKQRIARHALASIGATLACHDGAKLLKRHAAAPNFYQRAYHRAHHIAQEAVCGDAEIPLMVATCYPPGFHNVTQCGLDVGVSLAECAEIVDLKKPRCSLIHLVKVQFVVHLTRVSACKRVLASVYIIVVCALGSTESCVHIAVDRLHIIDGDVAGK